MASLPPPSEQPSFSLGNYLEIGLRRRWIILAVWGLIVGSTAAYVYSARPIFQGSALLLIERERGTGTKSAYANSVMVDNAGPDYYQTQYELLRSHSVLQKVYEHLDLSAHPEFGGKSGAGALANAISIVPVPRSRLVHVRVRALDRESVARIANALAELFVQENLTNQLFISKEVLQALQALPNDPRSRRLYEALPAVVNNSLIQGLKSEYVKMRGELAEMSQRLTPKHPSMIALQSHMDSVGQQIQLETERAIQSFKTELSGHLQGNNVRIVDRAVVPDSPVWPEKRRSLTLAVIIGFCLAYALAFLVELLDQTIRTQEDVERKLRLPFLGLLPLTHTEAAERVHLDLAASERSLTAEAFRNLRTMTDFAASVDDQKTFLVTSSVPDEGKTYVSGNIAAAFAQLGETVLLLSGDLRRPRLHKTFGVSNEKGLSDFLAGGKDVSELSALIEKTEVPGLSLMPCGMAPPNPSELLNTPRLAALVAWATASYDRVIVDCTPLFPISDTLLWGRHIPRAVFVVRYGRTRVPLVETSCQRLAGAGIKIMGVAINAARPTGFGYNHYSYGYNQYYQEHHTKAVPPTA